MSLSEIIWTHPSDLPPSSSGLSEVQSPRGFTVRVPELRGNAEELKNVPTVTWLSDGLLSFTWPTDHVTPSCTAGATCCSSGWWSTLCVCQPINQMVNDCFLIPPSPPAHLFFPLCIRPSTSFSFLRHYLVINFPNKRCRSKLVLLLFELAPALFGTDSCMISIPATVFSAWGS